jgi:molybdate transport system substrate-binding protein
MKTPNTNWSSEWSVEVRVRVERRGKTVLDERSADLLAALDRTESISAGARALGVSYRHAWLLIQEVNAAGGRPLTEASVGGQRGGGARLTEYGRAALSVFEGLQESLRDSAFKVLPKVLARTTHDHAVIHLFAAISLQEVVAQLLADYALLRPTVSIRAVFGASNELAEQILSGSSADVFISANRDQIDRLASSGMIRRGSRSILARNGLAAVASKGFHCVVRKPTDLSESSADRIIVADPACPLGKCTADFLRSAGIYDELRPRLLEVDNSRAVVSALRRSRSGLGLIFSSDVSNAPGLRTLFQVPANKVTASYVGAVTSDSRSASEAAAVLDFFGSKKAQSCFRRFGFLSGKA